MKSSSVIFASAIAALLAGCGGSDLATSSGASRVAQGGASSVEGSAPLAQMDEPLRTDQIPDLGKLRLSRQGGRYRLGDSLPGLVIDTQDREAVRMFYNGLYAGVKEPAMNWSGSYSTGSAGTISPEYQAYMLGHLNWFRAMAGVPAGIVLSPDLNAKNQVTAMLMSVNGKLSHFPDSSWELYSAVAADGASHSSIALSPSKYVVAGYIADFGSTNAAAGHRRSLFYPQTRTMGMGSVPGGIYKGANVPAANSIWNYDENFYAARPSVRDGFVAWPPRGYVPYQVTYGRWSLSYPGADFTKAAVVVTKDGVSIPVTIEPLATGYGENSIVWLLAGTVDSTVASASAIDQRYSVTVSGVVVDGKPRTFSYDVTVFDPSRPTQGAPLSTIVAPSLPKSGSSFTVQLNPVNGATGFDVLQYQRSPLNTTLFNTSNAAGNWLISTSGSYDPKAGSTFNLHHETQADQVLQLNRILLPRGSSSLVFSRSTGYATQKEMLKVQVTLDDGANWIDAYSETGSDMPTSSSNVAVDLTQYAGRKLGIRFLLTLSGAYYSCATCGWNLSDIALSGVEELTNPKTMSIAQGVTAANLTIPTPGDYALFGRTQLQGRYYSDVGSASLLHADGAVLTGPRANYTIVKTNAGYVITDNVGKDGVQTVINPFRLDFKDMSLAFDTTGNAGAAYRLYQAAFDRKPDLGGMGFWLKALDSGYSAVDMARGFMASAEFKALYGTAPTNEQLITGFYKNVLHRAPDAGGFDFWLKAMQNGNSAEVVLNYFADSPENRDQVAAAIANGIEYIPSK